MSDASSPRSSERRSPSSESSKERAPRRGKGEQNRVPKILHVSNLTRNVTADHLREIFDLEFLKAGVGQRWEPSAKL